MRASFVENVIILAGKWHLRTSANELDLVGIVVASCYVKLSNPIYDIFVLLWQSRVLPICISRCHSFTYAIYSLYICSRYECRRDTAHLTSNQHSMNLSVFRSMIFNFSFPQRNFEDTKGVVRSCKSTDRQYIGQTII
jgi:hypothetical protein